MAITRTTTRETAPRGGCAFLFPRPATIALAALTVSHYAAAAEWRVTPLLTVREMYTDNLRLAPSEFARSDFVTEIAPAVRLTRNGPGLKLDAAYSPQYIKYRNDPRGSDFNHLLGASADAELIKNLFYIDSTASINQQTISALGAQPIDNTNVTDNRATVKTLNISPYLKHNFGSTADSEVRYTHTATSVSTGGIASEKADALLLNLTSGPSFRTVGWGLRHNKQKIDNSGTSAVTTTATVASLQYLVTPQFYLTGTGGYETYNYAAIVPETGGASYTAGFSWKPTARTSISASAGHRFFGRTFALDSSVRSRTTVWQISYNEDITTSQSQAAIQRSVTTSDFLNQLFMSSIPDAAARQEAVDRFIATTGLSPTLAQSNNFFSNQFFLQKNLRASVAFTGAKNTVVFGLYNTTREAQTALRDTGIGGALGAGLNADTRQAGADLLWSWRLTPVTSANFSAAYSRTNERSTDAIQITKLARAALTRRLQPHLDGTIELRRQMQNNSLPQGGYVENAVSAIISMKF